MIRRFRVRWIGWLLALCLPLPSMAADCTAVVLSTMAAPEIRSGERPAEGWINVHLPDVWTQRWPEPTTGALAAAWYRIEWQPRCERRDADAGLLGFALESITMAGAVYLNDELLWRDVSLAEPLSLGWNQPRGWPLPA